MDFYAGNAREIGAAFTRDDSRSLEKAARAHVDFALHLSPTDLDILSEAAFQMLGRDPRGLLDCLVENVGGDGSESGADTVETTWVATIASIPDDRVEELAREWFRGVAEDRGDNEAELTDDALQALRDLIALCRTAARDHLDVVHTWSL